MIHRLIWLLKLSILIVAGVLVVLRLTPKPPLLDGVSFSPVVYDQHGQLMSFGLSDDDVRRQYVPLDQISSSMQEITLLYEDRYFYQHLGSNPVSLVHAFWNEISSHSRKIGASTITMQTARLLHHLNTRTWEGKLRQIALAGWLECRYSKQEILEAYFNLAPYGKNIEGIAAASLLYFHKPPAELSVPEALTLSVIPQNPRLRFPGSKNPKPLLTARKALFETWVELHPEHENKRSLIDMPLQVSAQGTPPFLAPHFIEDRMVDFRGMKGPRNLHTTLDLELQTLLEKQIRDFIQTRKNQGVSNAVALLVDYRTMNVLASIGSADYFDEKINGKVNGVRMNRSPGSALKPFIYALALDESIIQPHTMLKDAPASFGGYNPENFDRDFMGPVQACEALAQSRNIPAIYLTSRLKRRTLYSLLEAAQVQHLQPEKSYGLTIALGAAEVSPEDLARLYAMLANRGQFRPIRKLQTDRIIPGTSFLSPEASFLVLDMLSNNSLQNQMANNPGATQPIAWKTGTSYSFRDAWTVGVFDHYVLVVWVGNFDGRPNPSFVGRATAAPLFFSMIQAVRACRPCPPEEETWTSSKNLNLVLVDLCALTGDLASPSCTHRKKGWYIPGVSPLATCKVHQEILLDPSTGYRVTEMDAVPGARKEIWEVWPSDLFKLFQYAGLPRRTPPPFSPSPTRSRPLLKDSPETLLIYSPQSSVEYRIRVQDPDFSIPLQATAPSTAQTIYWFTGKTFLGSTHPGETLLWKNTTPGLFDISAIDDLGNSASSQLSIVVCD